MISDEDVIPPALMQQEERDADPQGGRTGEVLQGATAATPALQTSPATVKRRQRHLLSRLRRSVSRWPHDVDEGMDKAVFSVTAAATIAFVMWGFIFPHDLGGASKWALEGTTSNFGWLFVLSSILFIIFIVFVTASRFGKIPLGRDGEEPECSTGSWVSMTFATGMRIGLVFYGVGEPFYFYVSPPPEAVNPQTAQATSIALGTAMFHWAIYPWAICALVGLGMAYRAYRLGRSRLFSAMFTSLLGRQAIDEIGGCVINILAIVVTLLGSACSLGPGTLQIGGGMVSANLVIKSTPAVMVGIIAILTVCFVTSMVSGTERGIQWLPNINMVLAVLLTIIIFIGRPTLFILNIIPSAISNFTSELPAMASCTAAVGNQDIARWLPSWTIFYWAWRISWTPFMGMFIARISRDRTVRQFVTGVVLTPSVVSLIWFAIFGGGAIGFQEYAERAGQTAHALVHLKADGMPGLNFDTTLSDLLNAMPVHKVILIVLTVLAVVLVAIFFITGTDSASTVMGRLSKNGTTDPSRFTVVLWGVAVGGMALAMLLAGGDGPCGVLTSLRGITIISALPFVFIMLLLYVSLYKDLNNDPVLLRHSLANQVLVDSVTTAVTTANKPRKVETIRPRTSLSSTTDVNGTDDVAGEGCQDGTGGATQDLSADTRAVDGAEDTLRGSERRPEG